MLLNPIQTLLKKEAEAHQLMIPLELWQGWNGVLKIDKNAFDFAEHVSRFI